MKDYLIIDDWYTNSELVDIHKELDFLSTTQGVKTQETEGSAKLDGKHLANMHRYMPGQLYSSAITPINKALKKVQNPEFHSKMESAFPESKSALGLNFSQTNNTHTVINYYENNESYSKHFDVFQYTMLIWLYKKPKSFKGGDLTFDSMNKTIECKYNRMILFPSWYWHSVSEVKELKKSGHGRWCITHFFYTTPK